VAAVGNNADIILDILLKIAALSPCCVNISDPIGIAIL
jgi:hypothetical protein